MLSSGNSSCNSSSYIVVIAEAIIIKVITIIVLLICYISFSPREKINISKLLEKKTLNLNSNVWWKDMVKCSICHYVAYF